MTKPASLRAALEAASDWIRANPDRLHLRVESGSLRSTGADSLSFEYRYLLVLTLIDFPGHPSLVMVPLLRWLRTHQPELILNPAQQEQGLRFEVDLLNNSACDLEIRLQLSERVRVTAGDDGSQTVEHLPEPPGPWPDESADFGLIIRRARPDFMSLNALAIVVDGAGQ